MENNSGYRMAMCIHSAPSEAASPSAPPGPVWARIRAGQVTCEAKPGFDLNLTKDPSWNGGTVDPKFPETPFCRHLCSNFVRASKTREIAYRYTGCVTLSSGWFFLIGGATGAVRVAIAKRFFESDFTISEYVITDEQRKAAVHITPVQRWLIVLACVGVAIIGCFLIQHDANWNPFPHLRD